MIQKGIPAIVVRTLVFAYEKQTGSVKLGSKTSSQFTLRNGTRQGSVLSPYLFSACYLDGLIVKLRKLGLGCYVAGVWFGAMAYADDLVLLATSRIELQKMVEVCEAYAKVYNITFSIDPVPSKSKTKCLLFTGSKPEPSPAPVKLDGKDLPWVQQVNHLGHLLHQSLSMSSDIIRARAMFMTKASDIREKLSFAHPDQKMKAIQLYCCNAYGAMLWDLNEECIEKYFHAWNIQARMAWKVHRQTHTYLVEDFFCQSFVSLRNQVYGRYQNFVSTLENSPSNEVQFMAKISMKDPKSRLYRNLRFLLDKTDHDCRLVSHIVWKQALPKQLVPKNDSWRISLLQLFLEVRQNDDYSRLNTTKEQLEDMLTSLCAT